MIEPPYWITRPEETSAEEGKIIIIIQFKCKLSNAGGTVTMKCSVSKKSKPQYSWQKDAGDCDQPKNGR